MLEILVVINSRNHGATLSFGFSEAWQRLKVSTIREGYSFASGYVRNCSTGERTLSLVRVGGICSGQWKPADC
jgi:hypothetical protein